jgi:hypothetical protein
VCDIFHQKIFFSNFKTKSKSRVNWACDDFYSMIRFNNVNIELIENLPCDNANDLMCKKTEVIDKIINEIKINEDKKKCIKKYLYIRMYVCMYACICTSAKINKDK